MDNNSDNDDNFEDALDNIHNNGTQPLNVSPGKSDANSEFDVLLNQDSENEESENDTDSDTESEESWTQAADAAIAEACGDSSKESAPGKGEATADVDSEKQRIIIEEEEIRKKEALLSPEEIEVDRV